MIKNINVSVPSGFLSVNGRNVWADVLPRPQTVPNREVLSADELEAALSIGRIAILDRIEKIYEEQKQLNAANPTVSVSRPSIFVAQLGTIGQISQFVFSEQGGENHTNVLETIEEIQEPFHPFWTAVHSQGFRPEVRRTSGKRDGGAWLLLRRPTLAQINREWLGVEHELPSIPDGVLDMSLVARTALVRAFQDTSMANIDARDDRLRQQEASANEKSTVRSYLQIGFLLSSAALKSTLHFESAQQDVEDALIYATNSDIIPSAVARAIEIAEF